MSDKNSVVPNICNVLTPPSTSANEVLWSSSDYNHENGLPVIGSCQVSSILSTLENGQAKMPSPESKTRSAPEQNNPLEHMEAFKSIPINIVNSESAISLEELLKRKKDTSDMVLQKKLFQEMVYFGCNLCPFICTKDSKITDHINTVHKNKDSDNKAQLKCPGCSNIFYHKLSLRSHLIHDHEVGRSDINKIVNSIVYVSVLSKTKTKQSEKVQPEKPKSPKEHFIAGELSIEEENLENHSGEDHLETINFLESEKVETPKSTLTEQPTVTENEDYCPKQEQKETPQNDFKQLNNALRRVDKSGEEPKKTQKCYISTCAVRMRNVVNMAYHVKCHYAKVFRCLECQMSFVVWKTLQTHLWRAHQIDMELYSCDKCDYKTNSLAKLNNIHKLIHGNEKPFLCDLCGKGFKNPKQLRNHKIIHKVKTPDKLHKCAVCDRTFTDKRMLKVHVASVHQKIKPFSCTYCGYKASSNGALKLHIRQHTGEKPFTCDNCEYTTADHNSLRRHKSRHSGEKKYKCVHCEYACIQSSTYKTHLKTKHPGLENDHMFSCQYCQFRSVSKDKYMIHLASHKEKKKPAQPKILDIIENIGEETEGLEERVVELVSLNVQNKKVTNAVEYVNLANMKPDGFEKPATNDFSMPEQDQFLSQQKMYRMLKKQSKDEAGLQDAEGRTQETPVALISKVNHNATSNHCIILPVQNDDILNLTNVATDNSVLPTTTALPQNNIQYYYSSPNVLFEIIDEKNK